MFPLLVGFEGPGGFKKITFLCSPRFILESHKKKLILKSKSRNGNENEKHFIIIIGLGSRLIDTEHSWEPEKELELEEHSSVSISLVTPRHKIYISHKQDCELWPPECQLLFSWPFATSSVDWHPIGRRELSV